MFFKRKPHLSFYHHAFHVYRDWLIALGVIAFVSIGAVIFHVALFFTVQNEVRVTPSTETDRLTVNREELKQVENEYTDLAKRYNSGTVAMPAIVDPSL